ncbi:hypothetical protein HFO49_34010 [Rhizobium leguminosarum]|nr:hypothetical protein [Rhizobium leguminosarum]
MTARTCRCIRRTRVIAVRRKNFDADFRHIGRASVGPSLGAALWRKQLDEKALHVLQEIVAADALIIGAPTYKGSYPGVFSSQIEVI